MSIIGKVVVIGATNRIDSIDPALRRPGRFDREFLFTLPAKEARRSIFSIHVRNWKPPVAPEIIDEISEKCVGYVDEDEALALCIDRMLTGIVAQISRHWQQRRQYWHLDDNILKYTKVMRGF